MVLAHFYNIGVAEVLKQFNHREHGLKLVINGLPASLNEDPSDELINLDWLAGPIHFCEEGRSMSSGMNVLLEVLGIKFAKILIDLISIDSISIVPKAKLFLDLLQLILFQVLDLTSIS